MLSKEFRGEIWTNIDKRVLDAIVKANCEPVLGCVGNDEYSQIASEIVQGYFKEKIYTTYTINGTGANIIAMKAMLDRYSSIICATETHINVYEAGAFEYTLGNKIIPVDAKDGKLTPESIERKLLNMQKYKFIPKVVVITQPTEFGTLYTAEELRKLCDYAHSKGMYVYIDGARIGNAIVALGISLTEMIEETGVDAFSLGGTKAGAMFGEMVVFRRKEFAENLPYIQKQSFQHFDKSKFLGVQFKCLLENDIWLQNAQIANENAKILENMFLEKGIKAYYPVETNMVFAPIAKEQLDKITKVFDVHYWNEELKIVRFATTVNSNKKEMKKLIDLL